MRQQQNRSEEKKFKSTWREKHTNSEHNKKNLADLDLQGVDVFICKGDHTFGKITQVAICPPWTLWFSV